MLSPTAQPQPLRLGCPAEVPGGIFKIPTPALGSALISKGRALLVTISSHQLPRCYGLWASSHCQVFVAEFCRARSLRPKVATLLLASAIRTLRAAAEGPPTIAKNAKEKKRLVLLRFGGWLPPPSTKNLRAPSLYFPLVNLPQSEKQTLNLMLDKNGYKVFSQSLRPQGHDRKFRKHHQRPLSLNAVSAEGGGYCHGKFHSLRKKELMINQKGDTPLRFCRFLHRGVKVFLLFSVKTHREKALARVRA